MNSNKILFYFILDIRIKDFSEIETGLTCNIEMF